MPQTLAKPHPLLVCQKLLESLGDSGQYVWSASKHYKKLEDRVDFLLVAINHLRQRGLEGPAKYHELPVDPRSFVLSDDLLNMGDDVYPKVLDEIAEMCSGRYVEAVLTGGIGCVSGDTEFLTPTGWVRIDNYAGQEVAQYDAATGVVSFVVPGYHTFDASHFYHFKTKYGINQMLSPEHRVLYRSVKTGKLQVTTAQAMYDRHAGSVKGFQGKILTTFKAPESAGVALSPAEIRVMMMVSADAHVSNKTSCLVAVKKAEKIARAKALLAAAEIPYHEGTRGGGFVTFYFKPPLLTKVLSFLWNATGEQLRVALDEARHWDARLSNGKQLYTTIKENADLLQYAAAVNGMRASIGADARPDKPLTYTVTLSTAIEPSLMGVPKTPAEIVPANGQSKFCFTVPNTFWVARRGGDVFITGNTGKTTIALIAIAYTLYELACMKNPHAVFGIAKSSEIMFVFQSLKKELSKAVDYDRFRAMIDSSPFFQNHFRYDKQIASQMEFPKRIIVKPLSGDPTAAIGQNVFGGVIDEVNFMALIEQSKQARDGGQFDQATQIYNSIATRRQSRFMAQGSLPGMLCLVSSKQYPGEFTDRKMGEARTNPRIFVYDKRVWDVKPIETFSGKWFNIFVGDASRKPRILEEGEDRLVSEDDRALIVTVPEEYREAFNRNLLDALRDIAGTSTLALHPFLVNTEAVAATFGKVQSIASRPDCDFAATRIKVFPKLFRKTMQPRFAHIDLSMTGDSTGLAIGHVSGFVSVPRGEKVETMPVIDFDMVLEIKPPKGGEIEFSNVRSLLYKLREIGLPIKWVTLDTYQSTDTLQILRQQGFMTGIQSMDVDTIAYDVTKQALYDGRVLAPEHARAQTEFVRLERDPVTKKVDHPPNGSKDCSDAMAGVVYGLTMRREIWSSYGIPIINIPASLVNTETAHKNTVSYLETLKKERYKPDAPEV